MNGVPSKTLVILKVTTDDMDHFDEMVEGIRSLAVEGAEVRELRKEPIGFGIEILKAAILLPEKDDSALDRLTSAVQKVRFVDSVEVEGMTLL